jgi:predicted Rossmann-fold nucleotide-binding protein
MNRIRRSQVCMLGSAEPGSSAYELAGEAGAPLARLGVTVVSGCGSPAARVAAERAVGAGGLVVGIIPPGEMPAVPPPDERENSPILPWISVAELEDRLRTLRLV